MSRLNDAALDQRQRATLVIESGRMEQKRLFAKSLGLIINVCRPRPKTSARL